MSADLWMLASFLLLVLIGVPVAFSLALSGAIGILPGLSPDMLATLGELRILCAHRRGRQGVEQANRVIEQALAELNAAMAADPDNPDLHALAAASWSRVGLYDDAIVASAFALGSAIYEKDGLGAHADALRAFGHGVTQIPGRGRDGPVDLVVSVIRRKDLATVSALVNDLTPGSFVAVEEPTAIQRGWWFPKRRK